MTTEPNNQELACLVVLDDLSERLGEFIDVVGRPDEEERQLEAMDMLARSESRQFAIEHTRIESFSGQIADGVAFVKLLVSLETELFAGLAGHYWLTVPADASASVRAKDTEGGTRHHQEVGSRGSDSLGSRGPQQEAVCLHHGKA